MASHQMLQQWWQQHHLALITLNVQQHLTKSQRGPQSHNRQSRLRKCLANLSRQMRISKHAAPVLLHRYQRPARAKWLAQSRPYPPSLAWPVLEWPLHLPMLSLGHSRSQRQPAHQPTAFQLSISSDALKPLARMQRHRCLMQNPPNLPQNLPCPLFVPGPVLQGHQ